MKLQQLTVVLLKVLCGECLDTRERARGSDSIPPFEGFPATHTSARRSD